MERETTDITIEEVAAAAGVNKTTVYRRWPTPIELIEAVVAERATASLPVADSGDLRADLEAFGRRVRATVGSPLGRALLGPGRTPDPALVAVRAAFWEQRFAEGRDVIDAAAKRQDCRRPDDYDRVIELLVAPIAFRLTERDRPLHDHDLHHLVEFVLADLTLDRPSG